MKYAITLEYQEKQYSFLDDFNYEGWDAERNADHQVIWMYTEGNYGCDCNLSDFIGIYCKDGKAFPDLPCGQTISLVSIHEGERIVWPNTPLAQSMSIVREDVNSKIKDILQYNQEYPEQCFNLEEYCKPLETRYDAISQRLR